MAVVQDSRGVADAAASAEAAIAADPEGLWPTIAMSYRRAHEGKPDEAVALAQKAVAAGGGRAAKAALGHALQIKGDLAGAEAAYREAVAAEPTSLASVVGLATVLRKTGRAAEAEPMLKKAIDASPGSVEALQGDGAGQDRPRPRAGGRSPTRTSPRRWRRTTPRRRPSWSR